MPEKRPPDIRIASATTKILSVPTAATNTPSNCYDAPEPHQNQAEQFRGQDSPDPMDCEQVRPYID